MSRLTRISLSRGLPSRLRKPPGIFPQRNTFHCIRRLRVHNQARSSGPLQRWRERRFLIGGIHCAIGLFCDLSSPKTKSECQLNTYCFTFHSFIPSFVLYFLTQRAPMTWCVTGACYRFPITYFQAEFGDQGAVLIIAVSAYLRRRRRCPTSLSGRGYRHDPWGCF